MHGVNPKKLLPIAAAFMFSASASHMSIPMNAAYSAENEMSITADSIIPDGLYSIKNVNSGKYLSQRYGNVLQLGSPKAWRIINQPDGSCFITYSDDYALTVECGTGSDGNNISLQRIDGSESQKFLLKQAEDNTYALLTVASGGESAVDVYNISKEDGANICQWDYWGGDGQRFVLEAVPETENDITDVCLPVELNVSRNTNPFAGNITKQNEHYNYGGDPAAFVDGDTVYKYPSRNKAE